jgi:hypothetical protein
MFLTRGLVLLALLSTVSASAQDMLEHGTFDELSVGTNPDCDQAAGPWEFPDSYQDAGLCEPSDNELTIVATGDFESGATGDSLALRVGDYASFIHLVNLLTETIERSENRTFVCSFEIWVSEEDLGGGSMYLGAGGYDNASQRGPQITWWPDGTASARVRLTNGSVINVELLSDYPIGAWQSWFLRIDLQDYTFDAYYALRGEPLTQVGEGVGYRSTTIDFVDRFTRVYFGDLSRRADAYLDNVRVYRDAIGDLNCDGSVDFNDIDAFVTALISQEDYEAAYPWCLYAHADINGDGSVDFNDIDGFVECLIDGGCP